jgi:hypothetical protein
MVLAPGAVKRDDGQGDRSAQASTDHLEVSDMARVEARLVDRFCPPLRAEEVQRCLYEVIVRFQDAPVRTYLSVLIERAATDHLRAAVSDRQAPQR